MTSVYRYIDHTADIAIEVSGNNYAELFIAALDGWKNAVIETSEGTRRIKKKNIDIGEGSIEELLVSFLQELNYLLESSRIFPVGIYNISIQKKDNIYFLKSIIRFGDITERDNIKAEIKAVTFHQLDVKKTNDVFNTIIVFDI